MRKILKTTPLAFYYMVFVAFIMHVVMYTAKDRENYIKHFSDPFNNRLEPLFQWYMWLLDLFFTPHVAIVVTCVLIYAFFYNVWFKYNSHCYIIYFLFFNFIVFSVFNYYLGTSIRMGLAIAVGLYSASKILRGVNIAWIGLVCSPLIHYGLILFLGFFVWYFLVNSKSKFFHYMVALSATVFLVFGFDFVLGLLGLSSYYLAYFYDGFGETERVIPFTVAYFILASLFIGLFFNGELSDELLDSKFFFLSILYSLPFVFYQLLTGVAIFAKMLMPQFFFMSIMLAHVFIKRFYLGNWRYLYIYLFVVFNFISFFYSLRMYQFI